MSRFMVRWTMALTTMLAAWNSVPAAGSEPDQRLQWWREARFGLFIHWGLYAIPAGEWDDETNHGEWIMHTAQIPVAQYEKFAHSFNPTAFDARRWVQIAREAGMKYIVITTKHHDGFCLFDSAHSDYDIMATPFRRDIMRELSDACREAGLRIGWYHSILDWHHPDYLPRREWDRRSAEGAQFERYVGYLRSQVRELLTRYGPVDIMWFDGQWEETWTHEHGADFYNFVRSLQPGIIVNNRVDKGSGMDVGGRFAGDFGTPEQTIPPTGVPGVDWESCMTMNRHWGYNRLDDDWKSSTELIRMLVDIASKGGNFLLNVGPMADGRFPEPCIQRLRAMGEWLKVNGESIYGTTASPLPHTPWGRCTTRSFDNGNTRLYLHIFDWPADRRLVVSNLLSTPIEARLLADPRPATLAISRNEDAVIIELPDQAPDAVDSVIVLDILGRPDVGQAPRITAQHDIFVDKIAVTVSSDQENVELRYTTDGSVPGPESPLAGENIILEATTTITARAFRQQRPVSSTSKATFTRVEPARAMTLKSAAPGLRYEYFEGEWESLPDFDTLAAVHSGVIERFELTPRINSERFGLRFSGFLTVPADGVYTFYTTSDDGSRMRVAGQVVVNNDGLHGPRERQGVIALSAGWQPVEVIFFERTGGDMLEVHYSGPGIAKQLVPALAVAHIPDSPRAEKSPRPAPSSRQLNWHRLELSAFIHFGINTFTDREWGDGREDPALFNPSALDAGQWVRVCRDAGFKQIILTAKHHDGFCLWPTAYTAHSVASSPWRGGKGDVVGELAEACRQAGLKFGIYLSPWDQNQPAYGDSPRYNDHYKKQLTELLTRYGPISEVWFDGACGEGPNGKRQVYDRDGYIDLVRRLQPGAVIFSDAGPDVRWVGNEHGVAGVTNWCTLHREQFYPGTPAFARLTEGHIDGAQWVPAECDVSIRPGWFYHPAEDSRVKSVTELVDIYYKSVGRGAGLLLNLAPDRRGLIPEIDADRLVAFGRVIEESFRHNLAWNRPATAADGEAQGHDAGKAVDGDPDTYWTPGPEIRQASLVIELDPDALFDRIWIQEAIQLGQHIQAFAVEAWDGHQWHSVAEGTTIGYKRLLRIEPGKSQRVRLLIRETLGPPAISEFGLYRASPQEKQDEQRRE